MRFHVPQFLDIEDKIFGPLSFKQFIYLAGGGGAIAVIWYLVGNLTWTIILGLPVAVLSVALAFYKINQKPFIYIVEAFFKYFLTQRMYIWKKQPKDVSEEGVSTRNRQNTGLPFSLPRMSNSKLKDIEWNVDISETHIVPAQQQKQANQQSTTPQQPQ